MFLSQLSQRNLVSDIIDRVKAITVNRSRVERYQALRKKISEMDNYSFDVPSTAVKQPAKKEPDQVIKRTTLSLSIDELMKENTSSASLARAKEVKSRYFHRKREERRARRAFSLKILAWVLIVLMVVTVAALLIAVISGAFNQ